MAVNLNSIVLINTTVSDILYPVSNITVPASSSLTVSGLFLLTACIDNAIRTDIQAGNLNVGDGINTYTFDQASSYLDFLFSLIPLASGHHFYKNITGNATTVVKPGPGFLGGICLNNNASNGAAVIYDNTAGSGTIIATLNIGSPGGGLLSSNGVPGPILLPFQCQFGTGLTIVTSGSTTNDLTALFR